MLSSLRNGVFSAENGQFKNASGVAVDSEGNVYVADKYNNCIQYLFLVYDILPYCNTAASTLLLFAITYNYK